jgi:3-hydroxybutyryl-CoA dehydrogenase
MSVQISKAGVAGAGAMGLGIAQVLAQAGLNVILYDVNGQQLDKARATITQNLEGAIAKNKINKADAATTLNRITYVTDVHALQGELIIEAIIERLDAKRDLFKALAAINTPQTILATNTSSIPITQIAGGIPKPERVAGMHFFNPAHIMKLVEIISGVETSPDVTDALRELAVKAGKTPVMCKDSPGFIVNRVARHYYVESLRLLEENVTSIENIDALMESAGFKMGPFKLMDFVGNDINFAVTSSLFESFHQDAKFRPSRLQEQKVLAGHLGKKSGKGFYDYDMK